MAATMETTKPKFKILSLDGGGVRGLITAKILHEIEDRAHKPISELFDLIVGTSTGGILALALNYHENGKPKFSAKDLEKLYSDDCSSIFTSSIHKWGALGPKHDRSELDKILHKYFGNHLMHELKNTVCVTSYSLLTSKPNLWCSDSANVTIKDVAGATSAAPTFFSPKYFKDGNNVNYAEIDGGIFLNNPESMALIKAYNLYPDLTKNDFFLLSIGTGAIKFTLPAKDMKDAGAIKWLTDGKLIDIMMGASSAYSSILANQYCANRIRLQVELTPGLGEMDNCSEDNIDGLILAADQFLYEFNPVIDVISEELLMSFNATCSIDGVCAA